MVRECGNCKRFRRGTVAIGGCSETKKSRSADDPVCDKYDPKPKPRSGKGKATIRALTGENVVEDQIAKKLVIGGKRGAA
jgi:hypothetical protein